MQQLGVDGAPVAGVETRKTDIKINNLGLPQENGDGEIGELEDFICSWFRNHSERNDRKTRGR